MLLTKAELIAKLEKISALYDVAIEKKNEMNNYEPDDNYDRSIIVPSFPGEFEDDVRERFEDDIDHSDEDAIDQVSEMFDDSFLPTQPQQLNYGKKPENAKENANNTKQKLGCLPIVAIFIAFCVLVGGGLFGDDATTKIINVVLIIACAIAVGYFVFKLMAAKKADEQETAVKIQEYESEKVKKTEKYNQDMAEYQSSMNSFKLLKADFIEEYTAWRKIYLEHLKEEAEIKEKLEADRAAGMKKIRETEFQPALDELNSFNNIITAEYLPVIDTIIDLLRSGRADGLKEAINLYEEIEYRERQLKLEREKENQRRYEEERRRQEEERRHREDMAQREAAERRRRYDEQERLRVEDERRAREDKERAERERKAENAAKSEASRRCHWCKKYPSCSLRVKPPLNCAAFEPDTTHHI